MYSEESDYLAVRDLVFPPMRFTLSFEFGSQQCENIVNWLEQVSPQISTQLLKQLRPGQSERTDNEVNNFASCISAMALLIYREVDCPVFNYPEVCSIQQNAQQKKTFDVVFSFQNIGFVSAYTIQNVLTGALDICNWLVLQSFESHAFKRDGLEYFRHILTKQSNTHMPGHPVTTKLCDVAHSKGVHYSHLENGTYRFGWGKQAVLVYGSVCQSDSFIGVALSRNKAFAAQILRIAGIATPSHGSVIDITGAEKVALALGFPVVVKPVDCDRGEGVSLDIYDEHALSAAFSSALDYSTVKSVLIEKQVPGVCHRLFMVKGKLLYAVKRWPPSVFGDGRSDIKQLVEQKYQAELLKLPSEQQPLLPWDSQTEQFILQSGFTASYIPVIGERISLRRIESSQWGGYDEDVTDQIHPETLRQASVACGLFQLSVCGVDVITEDISLPLSQTGGVINELNGGPLLGGGAISRACIPEYLQRLLPDKGKIGIKIFRTEETDLAWAYFKNQLTAGLQCYFTSDNKTFDHLEGEMLGAELTLAQRLRILIFHPEVESLCIVTDRWAS